MQYVYANVRVKYGKMVEFNEVMVTIKQVMERNGWKLVGAYSTLIGDLHEVHDIWEIEDANVVASGFAGAYTDPDFLAAAERLTAIAEKETLSLVLKTPYSP